MLAVGELVVDLAIVQRRPHRLVEGLIPKTFVRWLKGFCSLVALVALVGEFHHQ
jgi:hypothetical protein